MIHDFFVLLYIIAGCLTATICLTLIALLWSGKMAFPGTEARKLMLAKNRVTLAELNEQATEIQFRATQNEINRKEIENRWLDKEQKKLDENFHRELERGSGAPG